MRMENPKPVIYFEFLESQESIVNFIHREQGDGELVDNLRQLPKAGEAEPVISQFVEADLNNSAEPLSIDYPYTSFIDIISGAALKYWLGFPQDKLKRLMVQLWNLQSGPNAAALLRFNLVDVTSAYHKVFYVYGGAGHALMPGSKITKITDINLLS
jgi:hypothetical protein